MRALQCSQRDKQHNREINMEQAAGAHCALMIYEGLRFMRIVITLMTVNRVAFALVTVGCQQCLWDGFLTKASLKSTFNHCKNAI